jgi:hypothetical protein
MAEYSLLGDGPIDERRNQMAAKKSKKRLKKAKKIEPVKPLKYIAGLKYSDDG